MKKEMEEVAKDLQRKHDAEVKQEKKEKKEMEELAKDIQKKQKQDDEPE